MADTTILNLTEEENPNLTESFVMIDDNSDPLNPITRRTALRDLTGLGWANYRDTTYTVGSKLTINNAIVQIPINGLGSGTEKSFLPKGVTDFWDTSLNKITPENLGDCFMGRLDFIGVPTGSDVYFDVTIDIGDGSVINIFTDVELFPKGTGVAQNFSLPIPTFALTTFNDNGGKIYISTTTGSKNMAIYDIGLFIQRTFAAN